MGAMIEENKLKFFPAPGIETKETYMSKQQGKERKRKERKERMDKKNIQDQSHYDDARIQHEQIDVIRLWYLGRRCALYHGGWCGRMR